MCTVVVGFDPEASWPVVLLGLRDEEVGRAWDPPGAWWPHLGRDVIGIHDRQAGGAWLAADRRTARASVVLNRVEPVAVPFGGYLSRGVLPLESVAEPALSEVPLAGASVASGQPAEGAQELPAADPLPRTRAFNLVDLDPSGVGVTRWDGVSVTRRPLEPGVHMITHEGPDDPEVARERRWLPAFRDAERPDAAAAGPGWEQWLAVLASSAGLAPDDDEALVRRTDAEGHRYESLSVTALALRPGEVSLRHARLATPGRLGELDWR